MLRAHPHSEGADRALQCPTQHRDGPHEALRLERTVDPNYSSYHEASEIQVPLHPGHRVPSGQRQIPSYSVKITFPRSHFLV